MSAPAAKPLNARQQKFVDALLADPTCTHVEAYIRAGYSKHTAKQGGHDLSRHPGVIAALAAARQKLAEERHQASEDAAIDARWFLLRAVETYRKAEKDRDRKASVSALTLIGKHLGLTEKRVRFVFDDPADALARLRAMPPAERKAAVIEMLAG